MEGFSLNQNLINTVFHFARPLGHNENPGNYNLGFGFLYYGLVRAIRPEHILVIGSGFGFSVVCLALGLRDNGNGFLTFIDPSYHVLKHGPVKTVGGRGMWNDPHKVNRHFSLFGVEKIVTHYKLESAEFFNRFEELGLPDIDIAFVDGNHSFKNVKHDFSQTLRRSKKNSYILLHDTNIYVREFIRNSGVKRWLNIIKKEPDCFEVLDFPFASGVAVVHVLKDTAWKILVE